MGTSMSLARMALLLTLVVSPLRANATTIAKLLTDVNPTNAAELSVLVRFVDLEATCKGLQVWIATPATVTSAAMRVTASAESEIYVPLPLLTLPPDDSLKSDGHLPRAGSFAEGWLLERRAKLGFLSSGFHGVQFCVSPSLFSSVAVEFDSNVRAYHMAPLNLWSRPASPSR